MSRRPSCSPLGVRLRANDGLARSQLRGTYDILRPGQAVRRRSGSPVTFASRPAAGTATCSARCGRLSAPVSSRAGSPRRPNADVIARLAQWRDAHAPDAELIDALDRFTQAGHAAEATRECPAVAASPLALRSSSRLVQVGGRPRRSRRSGLQVVRRSRRCGRVRAGGSGA